jgi:glutathione S-transferase
MHMHTFQKVPLGPHPNLRRWMVEDIERLPCWERSFVGENFSLERKNV